jgi:hypothetical protein
MDVYSLCVRRCVKSMTGYHVLCNKTRPTVVSQLQTHRSALKKPETDLNTALFAIVAGLFCLLT